jgi:hypothetical protein
MEGGTSFTFVTDGIASALKQAFEFGSMPSFTTVCCRNSLLAFADPCSKDAGRPDC